MGDVITIDNFQSKMAKLDPQAKALFGLVDMGSNGIRFSISDLSGPQSRLLPCLYRERAGISLYDALHDSKAGSRAFHFSPEIISTVSGTLARFRGICDSYFVPPTQISVFATEAMRTSENRDEMLSAIKKASGLDVQILSPAMESLFGAMGARTGFDNVDGLFMDLGGGSVQMTYVNSHTEDYDILAAKAAQSMPYGAAKVSAQINTAGAQSMRDDLQNLMKNTFEGLKAQFPQLKANAESAEGITLYFCGGGFRGYGSMLMHTHEIQPYPIPAIGGFMVAGSKFIRWEDMLKVNESYKGKIYGLSKRRREQFHAIVTVVESLVKAVPNIKQVVFCSGGNREGVLYMKLPQATRESLPLPLLPGGSNLAKDSVANAVKTISQALPANCPKIFSLELLQYVVQNTWIDMGDPDDANSAKALHNPISGLVAGMPGLTHEIRSILALILCARWGTDIGPVDQRLYQNLRQLIGPEITFFCDYIGTVARLLATIAPGYATAIDKFENMISFVYRESSGSNGPSDAQTSTTAVAKSSGLGKKGKLGGIQLEIGLKKDAVSGIDPESLTSQFKKIGDGSDQRVEAKFVWE